MDAILTLICLGLAFVGGMLLMETIPVRLLGLLAAGGLFYWLMHV